MIPSWSYVVVGEALLEAEGTHKEEVVVQSQPCVIHDISYNDIQPDIQMDFFEGLDIFFNTGIIRMISEIFM